MKLHTQFDFLLCSKPDTLELFFKGIHTVSKKSSLYQEPKFDNPETSILLLNPWNSICNKWYRTPNMSGGAPFSATRNYKICNTLLDFTEKNMQTL